MGYLGIDGSVSTQVWKCGGMEAPSVEGEHMEIGECGVEMGCPIEADTRKNESA